THEAAGSVVRREAVAHGALSAWSRLVVGALGLEAGAPVIVLGLGGLHSAVVEVHRPVRAHAHTHPPPSTTPNASSMASANVPKDSRRMPMGRCLMGRWYFTGSSQSKTSTDQGLFATVEVRLTSTRTCRVISPHPRCQIGPPR